MAEKRNPKTGRKFHTGHKPDDLINTRRIQGKALKGQKSLDYLKPKKFRDYLTLTELSMFTQTDQSWLRRLEADGRIPKAARVPMGKLTIRLWSPKQAEEIKSIIERHKVGRPKNT